MRILKIRNGRQFRKATATGLVPLLLLVALPGCVARHMPDWSRVQAVSPETTTELQLYKDSAPQGARKIKGRFLSATDESVTLKLKDGQTETFQKKGVRKVLTRRPLGKRWPGWVTLAVSSIALAIFVMPEDIEMNPPHVAVPVLVGLPSLLGFYGSRMGGIYEVPLKHRDWFPQGTASKE